MKFDDLAPAWQASNQETATQQQRDELIATTCRRVERLWGKIFRRDLVETAACLLVFFLFVPMLWDLPGAVSRAGAVVVLAGTVGILYQLHRWRFTMPAVPVDAPVLEFCRRELKRLDVQVELLRTVAWWYLAPILIGVNLIFSGVRGIGVLPVAYLISTLALGWFLYYLNQNAMRKNLLPIRDQLRGLAAQLEQEEGHPAAGNRPSKLKRALVPRGVWMSWLLGALVSSVIAWSAPHEYAKLAPFAAVRWDGQQPEVLIDQQWYTLVSIDGATADEIVAFSQRAYDDKWRKRFEEDLVELLTRMGHRPGDTVRLVVKPLDRSKETVFEEVPMTEENRRAIRHAAEERDDPFAL